MKIDFWNWGKSNNVEIEGVDTAKALNMTNTAQRTAEGYGLVPDYLSFRNTFWGQMTPVNYKLLWKSYLEDPIIRACVDITADAVMADGFVLKGKSKRHKKIITEFFKDNNFQMKLRDIVDQLLIFGDAYLELVRDDGGILKYVFGRDASTIRIDYNEHGEVIKYIQRVLHRRVDFYPDEMIHFRMNIIGGRQYGTASLQSVIVTLQAKQNAELYNSSYFQRGAMPRMLYILEQIGREQVERVVQTLKQILPHQDIVLSAGQGKITQNSIAPNNQDMQFKELLYYYRSNIMAALGVPPLFLGITEGSNRANAQTQMEAFDRRKKYLRTAIADEINNKLLTVENFGFDDIQFDFSDENSREELKFTQKAQLMSGMEWVTPNQILEAMRLPVLGEKVRRIDPETGEFSEGDESEGAGEDLRVIGNTPLFFIHQRYKMQANGRPDNKNPNMANPETRVGKVDRAEAQNVEQQKENKALHGRDRTETGSKWTPMNQPSGRGRIEQGSASIHYDEERRNPYGAVPIEVQKPKDRLINMQNLRIAEIEEVVRNPATNVFDVNTDRVFPKDKPVAGDPTHGKPTTKPRTPQDAERDEVDAVGRTRWASPDKHLSTKVELTKDLNTNATVGDKRKEFVFYKGTTQLKELGIDNEEE